MILTFLICTDIIGLDFGNQFFKFSETTISGFPKMYRDSNNKIPIPSAAAINKPIDFDNLTNISEINIKFGYQALRILKKKPELGYEFLPRVLGRKNTSFHTSKYCTQTELLSLYFMDFFNRLQRTPQLAIAVPFYWTTLQRKAITDALDIYHIPLLGIMEDYTALATLYSSLRYNRYLNASRNILFVDIGGTSVKIIGLSFIWRGNYSVINETASEWSEKTGGYYFAKAISKNKSISMNKAYKILINSDSSQYLPLIQNEINIIKTLLIDATSHFLSRVKVFGNLPNNSNEIDEIQLIGGSSTLKFLPEIIKNITNCNKILKDFNPNEAIALGATLAAQFKEGTSIYPPSRVFPIPEQSLSLMCNITHSYCQKGTHCRHRIIEEHTDSCSIVKIIADPTHLPEGTDHILAQYRLLNISNLTITDKTYSKGYFDLFEPYSRLNNLNWCNESLCLPIKFENANQFIYDMPRGVDFLKVFSDHENERRFKEKLISQISEIITVFQPNHINSLSFDNKNKFEIIKNSLLNGEIKFWEKNKLELSIEDLKICVKSLLPPPKEEEEEKKINQNIDTEL